MEEKNQRKESISPESVQRNNEQILKAQSINRRIPNLHMNTAHLIDVLKAAFPYIGTKTRQPVDTAIKAAELMNSVQSNQNELQLSAASLDLKPSDPEGMLCSIKEVCTNSERDMIDTLLNCFRARKLYQAYSLFAQNNTGSKLGNFANNSPFGNNVNIMEALKNIFTPEQARNLENISAMLNTMNMRNHMNHNMTDNYAEAYKNPYNNGRAYYTPQSNTYNPDTTNYEESNEAHDSSSNPFTEYLKKHSLDKESTTSQNSVCAPDYRAYQYSPSSEPVTSAYTPITPHDESSSLETDIVSNSTTSEKSNVRDISFLNKQATPSDLNEQMNKYVPDFTDTATSSNDNSILQAASFNTPTQEPITSNPVRMMHTSQNNMNSTSMNFSQTSTTGNTSSSYSDNSLNDAYYNNQSSNYNNSDANSNPTYANQHTTTKTSNNPLYNMNPDNISKAMNAINAISQMNQIAPPNTASGNNMHTSEAKNQTNRTPFEQANQALQNMNNINNIIHTLNTMTPKNQTPNQQKSYDPK